MRKQYATFALSLLVTLTYIPGIAGAATTPRWAIISIGVPALLMACRFRMTPAHTLLACYVFYAWLHQGASPDSIQAVCIYALFFACFCLGSALPNLSAVFVGAALGMLPSAVIAVLQSADIHWLPYAVAPSGLFINRNMLAEALALTIVGMQATQWRWPLPFLGLGFAVSFSRGALLSVLGAGVLLAFGRSKRLGVATILIGAVLGGTVGTLTYSTTSIPHRLAIWADTVDGLTWMGHGSGSFRTMYPFYATRNETLTERPDHAHNDYLEIAFEGGVIGFALFAAFIVAAWGGSLAARAVSLAFLIQAFFGFPFHMPATLFLGALCMGHMSRGRRGVFDYLGRWGVASRLRAATAYLIPAGLR